VVDPVVLRQRATFIREIDGASARPAPELRSFAIRSSLQADRFFSFVTRSSAGALSASCDASLR
jgi:hypothetical protein